MINIKELMLNNLVQATAQQGSYVFIVAGFFDNNFIKCRQHGNNKHEYHRQGEDIFPLPITPKNLALLGFENTKFTDVFMHNSGAEIMIGSDVYLYYSECEYKVKSIHQIQNVLQSVWGITLMPTMP